MHFKQSTTQFFSYNSRDWANEKPEWNTLATKTAHIKVIASFIIK